MESLGGVGGDEEEGSVVVGVFPGLFDGGTGLADSTHAVDCSRTSLNNEIRMTNVECNALPLPVGGLPGEDGDFKLDGLDGLLQAAHGIGGLVPLAVGG